MSHSFFTPNPPSSEQHGTFQTLSPPPPPPLASVTRPQSPRALSCDAQLRPLCLSLPAPEQKPEQCSPIPISKRGGGTSLPFQSYTTFSYFSLQILYPRCLVIASKSLPLMSLLKPLLGLTAQGTSRLGLQRPTILVPLQADEIILRPSPKSPHREGA